MYQLFCIKCIKRCQSIYSSSLSLGSTTVIFLLIFHGLLYEKLLNTLPLQIEPKRDDKLPVPAMGRVMPLGKN